MEEFKIYTDEHFFTSLHYGCKAVKDFERNSFIKTKPDMLMIVYEGDLVDKNAGFSLPHH